MQVTMRLPRLLPLRSFAGVCVRSAPQMLHTEGMKRRPLTDLRCQPFPVQARAWPAAPAARGLPVRSRPLTEHPQWSPLRLRCPAGWIDLTEPTMSVARRIRGGLDRRLPRRHSQPRHHRVLPPRRPPVLSARLERPLGSTSHRRRGACTASRVALRPFLLVPRPRAACGFKRSQPGRRAA